jgi:two-component system sensor histidine kinase BaeS
MRREHNEQRDRVASVCHDLRAPLSSVTMGASFVLQSTPDDAANARSRRVLEAMLRACAQMDRLVRNLADLAEIEGGWGELRLAEHGVQEMLAMAGEPARSRSVAVAIDAPADLKLRCDRDRVLTALGHFVDNAARHAPEGSEVRLTAAARDGTVVFAVADRGPGPTPEAQAHLFEVHGRSRGLAIARGFAELHGGSCAFERRDGESVFSMTLPREPVARPQRQRRPSRDH